MEVLVHNPENIPQEIVEKAIEMMEQVHEAGDDEIKEYGTYDAE